MKKVTAGRSYKFQPVGMDIWDARTSLKAGDIVTVVNLRGCPHANVMRHCHVNFNGIFAGLVLVASLQPVKSK